MKAPAIFYFTSAYPSHEKLKEFLQSTDPNLVKYVELGLPSDDPRYDGPVIRGTHSLARLNFRDQQLKEYAEILMRNGIGPYLLSYYRDFISRGEEFLTFLKDSGFRGILIPDLLVDYANSAQEIIRKIQDEIEFIPFFNPATPDSVIFKISSLTSSWIYYGLQPSTGIEIPYDLQEVSSRILNLLPEREVNFGFGIRSTDQATEIMNLGSSGVAIGTLIVPMIRDGNLKDYGKFQKDLLEVFS